MSLTKKVFGTLSSGEDVAIYRLKSGPFQACFPIMVLHGSLSWCLRHWEGQGRTTFCSDTRILEDTSTIRPIWCDSRQVCKSDRWCFFCLERLPLHTCCQ